MTKIVSVAILAGVTSAGCTRKNPAYCDTEAECASGEICDLSSHECVSRGSSDADAGADDSTPRECDVNKPFGPAVEVAGLHDSMAHDRHASLTANELTIFFASNRFDYSAARHVYTAHRQSRDAAFEPATLIPGIWNTSFEDNPSISPDGNTLYCDAATTTSGLLLVMSKRSDNTVAFPSPTTISNQGLAEPSITADGQTLYVSNLQTGFLARLPNTGGSFGPAEDVAIQAGTTLVSPATNDGLTLFMTYRGGAVHVTKRPSTSSAWPVPTEVAELSSHDEEILPNWISPDGCRLYMTYTPTGAKARIMMAARPN